MKFSTKSIGFAIGLAVASMLSTGPAHAAPAASGLANSGITGIMQDANQVTEVRRRGRRGFRHGRGFRRGGGFYYGAPAIGFGFGYGYPYYGGYYNPYPSYYRPRVRRSYRRSYRGSSSCRRAHRACVARWGYGGGNYTGCMRYEGCRPR